MGGYENNMKGLVRDGITTFVPSSLVGKTEVEALKIIADAGFIARTKAPKGRGDNTRVLHRVNLEIVDSKVAKAYIG